MTRISLRNLDTSGTYLFPINPNFLDVVDSSDYQLIETLDGSPARITPIFDSRVRTMRWPAYPNSNATFLAMIVVLKTYVGLEKEMSLGTIDDLFSLGWKHIKVVGVQTVLNEGGALRLGLELSYVYIA